MNGINEWLMNIQNIVDDIDRCIKSGEDEKLTLGRLSKSLGYSEYYVSSKVQRDIGNESAGLYEIPQACFCAEGAERYRQGHT